jgi:hypothetical protein
MTVVRLEYVIGQNGPNGPQTERTAFVVDAVKRRIFNAFGVWPSSYDVDGGWPDDSGNVVPERSTVIFALVDNFDLARLDYRAVASWSAFALDQDCVLVATYPVSTFELVSGS